ncbi:terminase ATPase subunit [Pseudoalteromonas phage PS_L5]|nr:terminase ATPase subunit [Pseudoalteromonas phage PS_L5]
MGNVMGIEWKEGAVCFADGEQWLGFNDFHFIDVDNNRIILKDIAHTYHGFKLNTIKQGDYIEASELDTEQKYNDVVEVFGLFGFKPYLNCNMSKSDFIEQASNYGEGLIVDDEFDLVIDYNGVDDISQKIRKLTYPQIMAIGELKRLEVERFAPKIAPDLTPDFVKDGSKYHREIIGLDGVKTTVDVYRILDAFKTDCAATDHAIKKMLCAGLRGHKDKLTDYDNAIESLQAAKELLLQREVK